MRARILWHVSEDGAIERFEPRANERHDSPEALVWAIDDGHVPAYWFPRDCPRATFWALPPLWDRVIASTLEFSGIPPAASLRPLIGGRYAD
jgi:uncharacterized protein DUF6886